MKSMKQFVCPVLIAALVMLPCRPAPAPIPVPVIVALKCISAGTIGAVAVILWKCEQPWYLCRYQMDDDEPYWAASQANPKTLTKTGGKRCEGPWKTRDEPDLRSWANNKTPNDPMYPCGPLGTIPNPTWTNYTLVSIEHTMNGGKLWQPAASFAVPPGDNWGVALLGPRGTNGMNRAELQQVMDCDVIVSGALPNPGHMKEYDVRGWTVEVLQQPGRKSRL